MSDGLLSREWFSAAELAELALPTLPTTERGMQQLATREGWATPEREGKLWRKRAGRGGGVEYSYKLLPLQARAAIALRFAAPAPDARGEAKTQARGAELWERFDRLTDKKKAKAREKLEALDAVEAVVRGGTGRVVAMCQVAALRGVALATLYNWAKAVEGQPRGDWLPLLVPHQAGGQQTSECDPAAWDFLKADYLRLSRPNFSDCYRRLAAKAAEAGWSIPSERTLMRKIEALPPSVKVLLRDGEDALKRMFPAQRRDRGVFHALEAVNADGHTWDVFVKWPDGSVGRPVMVAFQDLYSGKLLSWRVDVSENWHSVRLAFGDLVEEYGIPDLCWFDNGRHFASKLITGGAQTRYRFKIKDEDPQGLLTALGVEVHWTEPYSGQSKPIERAFRDFAQSIAKHPAFEGAYTGNSPTNKPANYGERAVPLADFVKVIGEGIREHNARVGRRTPTCAGRSFDETFAESYARSPIRRASEAQRRLWLLPAEAVTVRRQDGQIHFYGNRYWAEFLHQVLGEKVTARFDPEALAEPLQVYRLDGTWLGAAPCQEAAGFNSVEDAQKQARAWRSYLRATKQAAEAEKRMSLDELVRALPKIEAAEPPPEAKVVRPLFRTAGATALAAAPTHAEETDDEQSAGEKLLLKAFAQARAARGATPLRAVTPDPEDE